MSKRYSSSVVTNGGITIDLSLKHLKNALFSIVVTLLGMKIGYSPFDGSGFYFNPSVGASFAVTNRSAVYLTLGYNLQKSEIYFWNSYLSFTEKATIGGISIKLGVEF